MHITVRLHGVLSRYADGRRNLDVEVADDGTVNDVLDLLAVHYPGVERRIRDETGTIRPHINLFIDGTQLRELGGATHRPPCDAELLILPAVSGG